MIIRERRLRMRLRQRLDGRAAVLQYGSLHRMVADFAVAMDFDRFAVSRIFVGLGLVLMAVVAEVAHLGRLVLAIDGRHRPGVLDRQYGQQQDEQ